MAGKYEIVEHTADVGVRGRGNTLDELFAGMARGLFALIADLETVHPTVERRVELERDTPEELLHAWLDELNAMHQIRGELYAEFEPTVDGIRLTATVRGEPIDLDRHRLGTEIKAITWHDLAVRQTAEGYEAEVLLDV